MASKYNKSFPHVGVSIGFLQQCIRRYFQTDIFSLAVANEIETVYFPMVLKLLYCVVMCLLCRSPHFVAAPGACWSRVALISRPKKRYWPITERKTGQLFLRFGAMPIGVFVQIEFDWFDLFEFRLCFDDDPNVRILR